MNVSKSLVSCLLVGCASAQQTWIVDMQNAPGTHFLDFPPAVKAASPGNTIRVLGRPGVINYTMTTIDKPLRVLGMNGSLTGYGGRIRAWSAHNLATNSVVELDPRTYVNELTSSSMVPAPTHNYIHAAAIGRVGADGAVAFYGCLGAWDTLVGG